MIQSTGISIDNFYIPPFTLDKGEIVIIQLPNGPYFEELLFKLVDILTDKIKNENIEIGTALRFIEQVNEGYWRTLFFPSTVKRYIRKHSNPGNDVATTIYEFDGINQNTKISKLPGTQRKLLSLWTTFSWTDKIIFDLRGIDPLGGQRIYDLMKKLVGNSGAAILIDYNDEFKDNCTRLVKFELIPKVSNIVK
ncbi:MAG TPA: hypothetical protein VL443_27340 [Cyclobacteriaceae bacterium]|jgi:hypothetical protein|nr:hypothetical protein [Cyclobacteriaceae bacterium]